MRPVALLVFCAACTELPRTFRCEADDACVLGGEQGICELDNFCSFPDASCPSGSRYGGFAGPAVASTCVVRKPACVAQLALGEKHTCALRGDGVAFCWGVGGRLGTGNPARSVAPAGVGPPGMPLDRVAQLAAGDRHTCARLTTGGLWCWGANESGQLGSAGGDALAPREVALSTVTTIGTGAAHTAAVLGNSLVWSWGENGDRQLADDTINDSPSPVPTLKSPGVQLFAAQVVGGGRHGCALDTAGAVRCWGKNDRGQLGTGGGDSPFPADVAGLGPAASIHAGADFTCARLRDDSAWCWGADDGPVPKRRDELGNAVRQLATGRRHACALLGDGTLRCWGANENGQLGDATPVLRGVLAVAAGAAHTCAAARDGNLYCWGDNGEGQLGDGGTTPRATPKPAAFTCP